MNTLLPFPIQKTKLHEKRTELVTQVLIDTFNEVPMPALLEAIAAGHRRLDTGTNVFQAVNAGIDAASNWCAANARFR
jgi:hypothetical protein